MAALDDLIREIQDDDLRGRIKAEFDKLRKRKKFGLVFESAAEYSPLCNAPVKVGSLVAKDGKLDAVYKVTAIDGDDVTCVRDNETVTCRRADLIVVTRLGDSVYPALTKLDDVCRAPDSDLWHVLIEAENFHALQLLRYLYAGKVDCLYIDPPYNTGARDWKYNNAYVDASDNYRHSKWLSMMERRLALAKELLKPDDSVLIVTIDEKEYLHLGCLLNEMFRGAEIQMISSMINPAGVSRNNMFARTNEFIFFVMFGACRPTALELSEVWIGDIKNKSRKFGLRWNTLTRSGANPLRTDRPNLFYPIFVSTDGKKIISVGESYFGEDRNEVIAPEGTVAIWPIRSTGEEGYWQVTQKSLLKLIEKGYVRLGKFNDRGTMAIDYVAQGEAKKIDDGLFEILGRDDESGTIIVDDSDYKPKFIPGCQWNIPAHDSTQQGTKILNAIIGGGRFAFPKSLYAVRDALKFFVANKPDALILDFFAGSGTTLHAVNLLNAEDGGRRRCILVTNNEVSEAEAKRMTAAGLTPADAAWQTSGIARHVTWQRTVCSIEGHDINGAPLNGNYLGSDLPMADGFAANAIFFKLDCLDKDAVALGECFRELLPVLWLKAGGFGKCPTVEENPLPPFKIFAENKFAVLLDERRFGDFTTALKHATIETVFIATGRNAALNKMRELLRVPKAYRLYGDYLKNIKLKEARR